MVKDILKRHLRLWFTDDSDMEASERSSFSVSGAESEETQEAHKRRPVQYLGETGVLGTIRFTTGTMLDPPAVPM